MMVVVGGRDNDEIRRAMCLCTSFRSNGVGCAGMVEVVCCETSSCRFNCAVG